MITSIKQLKRPEDARAGTNIGVLDSGTAELLSTPFMTQRRRVMIFAVTEDHRERSCLSEAGFVGGRIIHYKLAESVYIRD
jgi:hypothetical protein